MEVKLDNLIEKIKQEGVDEGQKKADQLVKDAEAKAASIIEKAKKESEKIIADAEKQADQFRTNSELALQQAARDAELLLKSRITELFDRVFKQEVAEALTADVLKEIIIKMTDVLGKSASLDVVLNKKESKQLESILFSGVGKSLKETVELKPGTDVAHGFRIGLKGKDVYYDFTDEAITDVLKSFLKPRLKEILDTSHG